MRETVKIDRLPEKNLQGAEEGRARRIGGSSHNQPDGPPVPIHPSDTATTTGIAMCQSAVDVQLANALSKLDADERTISNAAAADAGEGYFIGMPMHVAVGTKP